MFNLRRTDERTEGGAGGRGLGDKGGYGKESPSTFRNFVRYVQCSDRTIAKSPLYCTVPYVPEIRSQGSMGAPAYDQRAIIVMHIIHHTRYAVHT